MAWGVRAAQLGQKKLLVALLGITILGGFGFMGIKTIEYYTKWKESIFFGGGNVFFEDNVTKNPNAVPHLEEEALHIEDSKPATVATVKVEADAVDPNAGGPDAALIKAPNITPAGLTEKVKGEPVEKMSYHDLAPEDQKNVYTFFAIYFFMTGLHGIHVLVGMALIAWIIIRSVRGEFGPTYFTPVDLVGLYWHLVDLIWIFLFPLLYLIH
jgi:cytochrome c oxidase subunit 3